MHTTRSRSILAGLCVAALALGAVACGSDDDTAEKKETTTTVEKTTTTAKVDELTITDVWARQSPMATTAGAIYLTITSPIDDQLTDASVPTSVAAMTQIHETVVAEDDTMSSTTMAGETSTSGAMATTTTAMGGSGDMTTTTAMGGSGDETTTTMAAGSMTMREVDAVDLPAGKTVELKPGGYHIMLLDLVKPLEVGDEIQLTLTFAQAGERTVTAEVREG